jgi:enterochelin esterase-like enzyme
VVVAADAVPAEARLPARLRPANGQALERAFYSPTLDRRMDYWIYLPPDYDHDATTRYPVLYLLHGLGGDRREWIDYGLFERADAMIADGSLAPLLIVLPEGETSYWVNHVDGPAWGDYVANDLVRYIDGRYRTLPEARSRAIGGLSMGAHGALTLAIHHPDRFGAVGLHSPSLRPADKALPFFGAGDDFRQRDPIELVRAGRVPATLRLWLDVGDEDWWLDGTQALHAALQEQEVAHAWHLYAGVHDSPYWADHIVDYLRFYGEALSPAAATRAPPTPSHAASTGLGGAQ